jgi:heptaprenylglyceryl phosphate synthase
MKAVYLEAGSGGSNPVPTEMIAEVAGMVDIPIITGGGLKTPEACAARIEAGASFVVMGSQFEGEISLELLKEVTDAVHRAESISV